MDMKEILLRIGYVRSKANLSARELSLRMGMSEQYISKLERCEFTLTMPKLLDILEICNFPIERFFAKNIDSFEVDNTLYNLISSLSDDKKKSFIDILKM